MCSITTSMSGQVYRQHPQHVGGHGQPVQVHYQQTAQPSQAAAAMAQQQLLQQQQSAAASSARTGGDGYMKGSSAWVWGIVIFLFILFIILIAYFLWSSHCRRNSCNDNVCETQCAPKPKCNTCRKSPCCCQQEDDCGSPC